jgi:hypothetical protein
MKSHVRPHHGPLLVPTLDEVKRIYDAMYGCPETDVHARSLVSKCEAVLQSDARWREPSR